MSQDHLRTDALEDGFQRLLRCLVCREARPLEVSVRHGMLSVQQVTLSLGYPVGMSARHGSNQAPWPILEGLGQVRQADSPGARQIGDGQRHLEDAMEGARR